MRTRSIATLSFAGVLLLAAFPWVCREEPDAEAQYAQYVVDLTVALVEFTAADLASLAQEGEAAGEETVEELAAKRDEFKTALLKLEAMSPPAEFQEFHNALPLYGQILEGMDLILEAESENDRAKGFAGRTLLSEAAEAIKASLTGD